MPSAEGDIVIIDIPVSSLYLAQQSALGTFGGVEDGIRPYIVGQHREQQSILAVIAEEVEVTHQVETQQQVALFLGERPRRVSFASLNMQLNSSAFGSKRKTWK